MDGTKLSHMAEEMDPAQEFEAKLLSRQKAMHEISARGNSAVQQWYNGTTAFVTGGSGFLGKQLVEKLLRATNISKIFILLRSKKGKPIEQRLQEMLTDPVYDTLREQKPGFEAKLVAIPGDVAELNLGMSEEDRATVAAQTDIIFHMAATTRFDEALRVSTLINVRGTREAIALGKACKKLKSFVHVSTAYSHARDDLIKTEVREEFYPSPVDPHALIKLAETTDNDRLNDITPSLIKGWPNTYSFAKAVAEEMVREVGDDLPMCVVRPAIVIAAYREPNPGWLDLSCAYGASGIVLGPGLGVMHVVYASHETRIGLIPVDYVNNAIITAGWETARRRGEGEMDTKIYTVIGCSRKDVIWGELSNRLQYGEQPDLCYSPASVWYKFLFQTQHAVLFWLYTLVLHTIPGYILDGICLVLGQERRFVKLYQKMYKMSVSLSYFTVNYWNFVDKNLENLYNSLSPADKEIFHYDVEKIDWIEYLYVWCIGLRKYVVKDGLKGSRYAVKKQLMFKIAHYVLMSLYLYMLYKIIYLCFVGIYLILGLLF